MKNENFKVLEIKISNKNKNLFSIFGDNKKLYLFNNEENSLKELAFLSNIELINKAINIEFYNTEICVSERYGLNASVVNINTGNIRNFSRKDYHADVSSYSTGFLERDNKILFIHQTEWNRLDITDLESGELLTKRNIKIEFLPEKYNEETKTIMKGERKEENYLDYFHSNLHISPDKKSFLSNGWVWSPVDNIRYFEVEKFFEKYELSSIGIEYSNGYNWDRPCTYIDNDTFLVVTDNHSSELDEDELRDYEYKQFEFYRLEETHKNALLKSFKSIDVKIFPVNEYGEVSGDIYYDRGLEQLIAMTKNASYILSEEAEIIKEFSDIKILHKKCEEDDVYSKADIWKYSVDHHFFYRFLLKEKIIEIKEIL